MNCSTAVLSGCEGDRNWVAMLCERLRFSGLQLINTYMGHWFSLCKKNGSIRTLNNYMPRSARVLLNVSFQSMCPQHLDPCAMSLISFNHIRATQHHIKSGPHEIKPQNQGEMKLRPHEIKLISSLIYPVHLAPISYYCVSKTKCIYSRHRTM